MLSQPGIKVIIRDLRGHLLHAVTFLVFKAIPKQARTLTFKKGGANNRYFAEGV